MNKFRIFLLAAVCFIGTVKLLAMEAPQKTKAIPSYVTVSFINATNHELKVSINWEDPFKKSLSLDIPKESLLGKPLVVYRIAEPQDLDEIKSYEIVYSTPRKTEKIGLPGVSHKITINAKQLAQRLAQKNSAMVDIKINPQVPAALKLGTYLPSWMGGQYAIGFTEPDYIIVPRGGGKPLTQQEKLEESFVGLKPAIEPEIETLLLYQSLSVKPDAQSYEILGVPAPPSITSKEEATKFAYSEEGKNYYGLLETKYKELKDSIEKGRITRDKEMLERHIPDFTDKIQNIIMHAYYDLLQKLGAR